MTRRVRILFVCGSNSCRSQLAEGLARARFGKRIDATSAGVRPGTVHPMTVEVMSEVGIDIAEQVAKQVGTLGGQRFDIVVTLCDEAREYCTSPPGPILRDGAAPSVEPDPLSSLVVGAPVRLHWPVADPAEVVGSAETVRAAFRLAREEIATQLVILVEHEYLEALTATHRKLEQLADDLPTGLVAHDEHRRVYLVNRAAERLLGVAREDVLGRDCHVAFGASGLCGANCVCTGSGTEASAGAERCESVREVDGRELHLCLQRSIDTETGGVVTYITDISHVVELRRCAQERTGQYGIIGRSAALKQVLRAASTCARSEYPIMITGESGTGKELLARAIHAQSARKNGPFVAVNCGAISEGLFESEFFGHVKGAFTGADRANEGRFALARGGTLFLDEIAELPLQAQVKLLRVLQDNSYERVGEGRSQSADVRVVCATAVNLRERVESSLFRDDLFFRLSVIPLHLPPLRERTEDLVVLLHYFLRKCCDELGRELSISAAAFGRLTNYHWPGNVRELGNVVRYLALMTEGDTIDVGHLPEHTFLRGPESVVSSMPPVRPGEREGESSVQRRELTVDWVNQVLYHCGGNRVRAAAELGVARATLYRFLNKSGMV